MKFIMAIFVVSVHTNPLEQSCNSLIVSVFKSIAPVAVPFFFVVSGYFSGGIAKCKKIKHYTLKIIRLYLLWSFLYLPLAICSYIAGGITIGKAVVLYFLQFFLSGEHFYSYHLWYLLSLIYSLIFISLLSRKLKFKWILLISALIGVCGLYLSYLNIFYNDFSVFMQYILLSGRTMTGMFPVAVGMYLKESKVKFNKWLISISFFLYFILKSTHFTLPPFLTTKTYDMSNFVFGIMVFIIIKQIDESGLHPIKYHNVFRRFSMSIYFIHMYFAFIYRYLIAKKMNNNGYKLFLFTVLGSLSISVLWNLICKKKEKNALIIKDY